MPHRCPISPPVPPHQEVQRAVGVRNAGKVPHRSPAAPTVVPQSRLRRQGTQRDHRQRLPGAASGEGQRSAGHPQHRRTFRPSQVYGGAHDQSAQPHHRRLHGRRNEPGQWVYVRERREWVPNGAHFVVFTYGRAKYSKVYTAFDANETQAQSLPQHLSERDQTDRIRHFVPQREIEEPHYDTQVLGGIARENRSEDSAQGVRRGSTAGRDDPETEAEAEGTQGILPLFGRHAHGNRREKQSLRVGDEGGARHRHGGHLQEVAGRLNPNRVLIVVIVVFFFCLIAFRNYKNFFCSFFCFVLVYHLYFVLVFDFVQVRFPRCNFEVIAA